MQFTVRPSRSTLALLLAASLAPPLYGQEGFPLDGTWRGEWGLPGGERTMTVVVMNWDGESIKGQINPGRNTIPFDDASLDAENWTVRIEATSREGEAIVIEGLLDNIGSYNRTITGTWTIGGEENQIVLTRE